MPHFVFLVIVSICSRVKDKFGVLIGSGIGGVEFFENNCEKFNKAGAGAKGLKKVRDDPCTVCISQTSGQE